MSRFAEGTGEAPGRFCQKTRVQSDEEREIEGDGGPDQGGGGEVGKNVGRN